MSEVEMQSESWIRWVDRFASDAGPQMPFDDHRDDQRVAFSSEGALDLLASGDTASKWGLTVDDLIEAMDL